MANVDPGKLLGILKEVGDVMMTEKGQRFLCGTYSDGKTRSLVDAMHDEFVSPKDREKWEKAKRKKKKDKKKNKKKKKKKSKSKYEIIDRGYF